MFLFIFSKILDEFSTIFIVTHQNSHLVKGHSGTIQAHDLFSQIIFWREFFGFSLLLFACFYCIRLVLSRSSCLLGLFLYQDSHKAAFAHGILLHQIFCIKRREHTTLSCCCFSFARNGSFGYHLRHLHEDCIIEVHNLLPTSEIRIEGLNVRDCIIFDIRQSRPVSTTPAIDTLLHIAHQHTTITMCNILHKEIAQIGPLQFGGVLEFIDHHVVKLRASSFKHKRSFTLSHHFGKKNRSISQEESVVLRIELLH